MNTVVFIGRFQPFHYGHFQMMKMIMNENIDTNYMIILVSGKKTSLDTIRNPFTTDYISSKIKTLLSNVSVEVYNHAYIKDIVEDLKTKDITVSKVYVGPDRFDRFQQQFNELDIELKTISDRILPKGNLSTKYLDKELSGSIVKQMIDDGDYDDFLLCTEGYNLDDFNSMKSIIDDGRKNKIKLDINEKLTKLLSKIESAKTEKTIQKYLTQKKELEDQLKE